MRGCRFPLLAALLATITVTSCSTVTGVPVMPKLVEPAVALDGLYRIVANGTGTTMGRHVYDLPRDNDQWAFRTICDDKGCVATGAIVDPIDEAKPPQDVVVADYVAGKGSIVTVVEDKCDALGKKMPTNRWMFWDIVVSPSKKLSLNRTDVRTQVCNSFDVTTPVIERVGDCPPGFPLPDPAELPQRSEPPKGMAFRGKYDLTITNRDDGDSTPALERIDVTTICLRVGDRCVTTAVSTEPREPPDAQFKMSTVEYSDGKFVGHYSASSPSCNGSVGGLKTATMTIELPEDPVIGPFEKLTGERLTTFTSSSCHTITDDLRYERIR